MLGILQKLNAKGGCVNDSEKLKAAPLALFRGIIALASLVLLAPASVCASSTAAGPVATRPTEQEIYEACGQGCLYQRANENIAPNKFS